MNSACWPLAVCSTTHGAILPGWSALSLTGWPVARSEPIPANTAIAAATKNNEQNTRRHRDGVNVGFGFLVFIRVGFVEVSSFSWRDLLFHASIPETKGEVPNENSCRGLRGYHGQGWIQKTDGNQTRSYVGSQLRGDLEFFQQKETEAAKISAIS